MTITARDIEKAVTKGIEPFAEKISGHHVTLYGEDGLGGLAGWVNKTNGHIKGMKYVLGIGLTIIGGINIVVLTAVLNYIAKG